MGSKGPLFAARTPKYRGCIILRNVGSSVKDTKSQYWSTPLIRTSHHRHHLVAEHPLDTEMTPPVRNQLNHTHRQKKPDGKIANCTAVVHMQNAMLSISVRSLFTSDPSISL